MGLPHVSKVVALVFDDPYKAEEARAALHRMGGEGLLEIDETAVIVRFADGRTRVSQDVDVAADGQKIGHVAGIVAAALTGTVPFIAAGTLLGRLVGRFEDHGITDTFVREVREAVRPGTSALILLARSDAQRRGRVMDRLRPFGPHVLQSDLPDAVERDLAEAIEHGTGPYAGR